MTPREAERIAFVAHAACGQYRANGVTPYISHPRRVAELVRDFHSYLEGGPRSDREVAAYLHDVIEDTRLTREHLLELGVTGNQLDIIERLTKAEPDQPATIEYYRGIAESTDALVVKCADRCANLEDALGDLLVDEPKEPRRWERYIAKTHAHVLPLYAGVPQLQAELRRRLDEIAAALPGALERRTAAVERRRTKAATRREESAGT